MGVLTMAVPAAERDDGALADLAHGTRGDRELALRSLHERHKDEVFGFLAKLLRDRALAEDVLQETFLQLHASFDRFERGRPFRPWVFQIARNAALKALRTRRKDERLAVHATPPGAAPWGAEVAARGELEQRVQSALGSLPDETRALLVQRHVLGMKLDALAESFDCTERTIRNRLGFAARSFARTLFGGAPSKAQEGGRHESL